MLIRSLGYHERKVLTALSLVGKNEIRHIPAAKASL